MRQSCESPVDSRTVRRMPGNAFPGSESPAPESVPLLKRMPEYLSIRFPLKTEPHAVY